jgi:hypothetical protein
MIGIVGALVLRAVFIAAGAAMLDAFSFTAGSGVCAQRVVQAGRATPPPALGDHARPTIRRAGPVDTRVDYELSRSRTTRSLIRANPERTYARVDQSTQG